jgi:hypothetical protein
VTQQTDELAKLYGDVAKYADAALRRLSEAQPGYPSGHDGTGSGSTQPERYEATLGDDAVRDLRKLREAQKQALHAGRDLWGVVTKWGVARDARSLAVADPEDEMWCRSCLTIGKCEPRRKEGGVLCRWCDDTLRVLNRGRAAVGKRALTELPRRALHVHAEGKRVTQRDLLRWAGIDERKTRGDVFAERLERGVTFMRSTVTCGACLLELPVPDGTDGKTVLREHHQGGCAA